MWRETVVNGVNVTDKVSEVIWRALIDEELVGVTVELGDGDAEGDDVTPSATPTDTPSPTSSPSISPTAGEESCQVDDDCRVNDCLVGFSAGFRCNPVMLPNGL